ncbi:hypothetical protein SDC9_88646 [bioreactor metagenome]|uniref:Uncharacterized protein n=1 Tax=bioreactor metagenome TaxID=1076179 RepID=A0A644ZWN4_9ZZZZ
MAVHDSDGNRDRNRNLPCRCGRIDVDIGFRVKIDVPARLYDAGHDDVDIGDCDGERQWHVQRTQACAGHREFDRAGRRSGNGSPGDDGARDLNIGITDFYVEEVQIG